MSSPLPAARSRYVYWTAFGIFVLTCASLLGTLGHGFVWDDRMMVVKNTGIRALDARHLRWMFSTHHMANWTPLSWLSLAIDYSVWGLNPVGYHLTNLLLHGLNAAVFYRVSAVVLGRAWPEGAPRGGIERGAAAAALFFALHPLRVESVAWVSERRDVLSGFFFLLALLDYLRARRARVVSMAFFAAAALSKPTVVPFPVVLLILDYFPLSRFSSEKPGALIREKAPYFAIALFAGIMALWAQEAAGNLVSAARHGVASRLAQSAYGIGFYLLKTLAPMNLSPLYPLPGRLSFFEPSVLGAVLSACLAEFGLRRAGLGIRPRLALWGCYGALLLPTLGLIQNGPQLVALRYSYLSCLGWAILAGAAMAAAHKKIVVQAVLGACLLAYAAASWRQAKIWRGEESLWTAALAQFPDSIEAHRGLAVALADKGDFAGAAMLERAAAELSSSGRR